MTHQEIVLKRIKEVGFVDNRWCLNHRIWRLSDVIHKLKKKGYNFKPDEHRNTDKNCHYYPIKNDIVQKINAIPPFKVKAAEEKGRLL